MDILIGPQATFFPPLSIASLGSKSVMIQIRTFDPVPTVDDNVDHSFAPGPLIARGVVLTLAHVTGPCRVNAKAQTSAVTPASATLTVTPLCPLPRTHFRSLSTQLAMAYIPLIPSSPRLSLRQIRREQPKCTPKPKPQYSDRSSPSKSLCIWFLFCWLVLASVSITLIRYHTG
ncbi:hypothetical protein C0995_010868 [Termitomyces sp. Mi166|nr:hypothetical protein C0995_010868 [Termitomyces sp. Mi166\